MELVSVINHSGFVNSDEKVAVFYPVLNHTFLLCEMDKRWYSMGTNANQSNLHCVSNMSSKFGSR